MRGVPRQGAPCCVTLPLRRRPVAHRQDTLSAKTLKQVTVTSATSARCFKIGTSQKGAGTPLYPL